MFYFNAPLVEPKLDPRAISYRALSFNFEQLMRKFAVLPIGLCLLAVIYNPRFLYNIFFKFLVSNGFFQVSCLLFFELLKHLVFADLANFCGFVKVLGTCQTPRISNEM